MSRTVYVPLTSLGLGTATGTVYDAERRVERRIPVTTVALIDAVPHVVARLLAESPAGYRVALPGAVEATVARVFWPKDGEPLAA